MFQKFIAYLKEVWNDADAVSEELYKKDVDSDLEVKPKKNQKPMPKKKQAMKGKTKPSTFAQGPMHSENRVYNKGRG